MLTISKALNASQAETYHAMEFTSQAQSYYSHGAQVQGEWQGQLVRGFGLDGPVTAEAFSRLANGQHPFSEEQMVQHRASHEYNPGDGRITRSVEHRAGWDATFSAPKSVSLTALVGGDERVREAHRAAVTVALGELERYTQARIGGNHAALTTGKFIAAKFEHDTARPVDGYAAPQLHTHAVIFNVTERPDGTTRALQERALFASQTYATAVYQSELMYRLRVHGYEIEAGRSGAPEIKGYSQQYLDVSSPRSQQIREQLEKTGYSGAAAAQIAAHATRDSKQILTPAQVLAAHRELASEFGNQPQQVIALARERSRAMARQQLPGEERAREAVVYARSSIYEREATADERLLMRDALRRSMGEATYGEVRTAFQSSIERGELREIGGRKHDSARSFTTPQTVAHERANIALVRAGQDTLEPIAPLERAREQANSREFLNPAQRAVVEEVLTSRDRIHGLQGLAGTGKTTVLATIREGAELSGYAVEGFAPSSRAAAQMREAGVAARTLQSFLAQGGTDNANGDPASRHLYMLDESSLASSIQMRRFLEKIAPQDRVLVIGDTRQHQAVEAGRPFEQMQQAGMRTSQLDQIMRQRDPALLSAVQQLAAGETAAGVQQLRDQGRVTEISATADRIQTIARDYAAQPVNTLIVSPDNRSRTAINEAVRHELQEHGTVARDSIQFRTLEHRSDMTGADRAWAGRYEAGDILQYTNGSKTLGIERGSYALLQTKNPEANSLTVEHNGVAISYDPRRLQGVNVYREATREIAVGERIQFTAPNKALGLANRELATVLSMSPEQITVRMDGATQRTVTFDPRQVRQFDYGYAMTSHSAQGLTAERVLANVDTEASRNLINARLAYVAVSRASQDVRIYTNDAEQLAQKLSAKVTKLAAVEFKPRSGETELHGPDKSLQDHHYEPLRHALTYEEGQPFRWIAETGSIESYRHQETGRNIHIDRETRQFLDQERNPITKQEALEHAGPQRERSLEKQEQQEIELSIGYGL